MKTGLLFGLAYKLAPYLLRQQPQSKVQYQVVSEKDKALLSLKKKEGAVIVILGARGSGKTELAYRLAEFIGKPTYAVSPEQKPHPQFITRIKLEEVEELVPPNSTLIADDVPAYMSSRDYFDNLVRTLEKIIPMVRHERKLHLIFCSQSASQADKYILDADAAFIKPSSVFFEDLERPGVKKLYRLANPYFDGKSEDWVRHHSFFISREWQGIIEVKKVTK